MVYHSPSLPPDPVYPDDADGWRRRCQRLERRLRVVTAQREVLAAVLKSVLEGSTPEMVAAASAAARPPQQHN